MSRWVLLGICVLFGTYLVLQLWPRLSSWRRASRRRGTGQGATAAGEGARRAAADATTEARARAAAATTPEARAHALAEAADAAGIGRRWTSAAGLYRRALRAHPAATGIAPRLASTVGAARPALAETILWRRLADLPDDQVHRAAAVEIADALASLYEGRLRDPARAIVLRRHAAALGRGS